MSRIELNLWDADEVLIAGNKIVVNASGLQLAIVLPQEFDLPSLAERIAEPITIINPIEEMPIVCNHPPIMHRISGGCNSSGCTCNRRRGDEPCDESPPIDIYAPRKEN